MRMAIFGHRFFVYGGSTRVTFFGQDDAEFQDGLGWHRNDYSGSFPFWIGEIFDQKRKKMGDRFSSEACEKYVTGFLHGAMIFVDRFLCPLGVIR